MRHQRSLAALTCLALTGCGTPQTRHLPATGELPETITEGETVPCRAVVINRGTEPVEIRDLDFPLRAVRADQGDGPLRLVTGSLEPRPKSDRGRFPPR